MKSLDEQLYTTSAPTIRIWYVCMCTNDATYKPEPFQLETTFMWRRLGAHLPNETHPRHSRYCSVPYSHKMK